MAGSSDVDPVEVLGDDPARWSLEALDAAVRAQLAEIVARRAAVARADAAVLDAVEVLQQLDERRRYLVGERSAGQGVRFRTSEEELRIRSLRLELALAANVTETTAGMMLTQARSLAWQLPAVSEALGEGRISLRHAQVLLDELDDLPEEQQALLEDRLLPLAGSLNPARLRDAAHRMRESIDPDDAGVRHARAMRGRQVGFVKHRDGMASVTIRTDAGSMLAAKERLVEAAHQLHDQGDPRTSMQAQADLAAGALLTARLATDGAAAVVPTLHVTVPALTLLGASDTPATLDGYGPIPVETAAAWATRAPSLRRVLTDPHHGAPLAMERDRYRVTGALREFLTAIAGGCTAPGCGASARRCDMDHLVEWQHGGATDASNLAPECRGHHTVKTHTRWSVRHEADRSVTWISPSGAEHVRRPAAAPEAIRITRSGPEPTRDADPDVGCETDPSLGAALDVGLERDSASDDPLETGSETVALPRGRVHPAAGRVDRLDGPRRLADEWEARERAERDEDDAALAARYRDERHRLPAAREHLLDPRPRPRTAGMSRPSPRPRALVGGRCRRPALLTRVDSRAHPPARFHPLASTRSPRRLAPVLASPRPERTLLAGTSGWEDAVTRRRPRRDGVNEEDR